MTLEEFVSLQRGHDLPDLQRRPGKVPILGSFGITGYHDTPKAKGPGVTIGRSGASFGMVSYSPIDYWPLNTVLYVTDFKGNDEKFVYYFLRSIDFTCFNSGSAQPSLNRNYIYSIMVKIPPLPEQHAISRVLGSLDDKIEANRRMNETLEAIARALFKSWFVDFDPVRAKAEGREPAGMDAETAALFPDSFEETELGMVPQGWKIAAIGDVVKIVGGSTPSTEDPQFWNGTINFATPKDLASLTSPILLNTERRITEKGLVHISSGLLPKGTVLLSSRAPIGYLALTEIPVAINQGFIALICRGDLPNYFAINWISQNMETIIGNANGTTFLEISKQNFRPIQLVIPSDSILKEFTSKVEALYGQLICNQKQNNILAAIRDSLLPNLISGALKFEAIK